MIAALRIAHFAFQLFYLLVFVRILSSWIPEMSGYRVVAFSRRVTEPYLQIFQTLLPPFGGIDFSPMIAIFVCMYLVEPLAMELIRVLASFA